MEMDNTYKVIELRAQIALAVESRRLVSPFNIDECAFCGTARENGHEESFLTGAGVHEFICDSCADIVDEEEERLKDKEYILRNSSNSIQDQRETYTRIAEYVISGMFNKPEQFIEGGIHDKKCYFCFLEETHVNVLFDHVTMIPLPVPQGQMTKIVSPILCCSNCAAEIKSQYQGVSINLEHIREATCPQCNERYPITDVEERLREKENSLRDHVCDDCNRHIKGANRRGTMIVCKTCGVSGQINMSNQYHRDFFMGKQVSSPGSDLTYFDRVCDDIEFPNCGIESDKKLGKNTKDMAEKTAINKTDRASERLCNYKTGYRSSGQPIFVRIDRQFCKVVGANKYTAQAVVNDVAEGRIVVVYETEKDCGKNCGCYSSYSDLAHIVIDELDFKYGNRVPE